MGVIKMIRDNKCWQGWKGNLYTILGLQVGSVTMEINMQVPQKLKTTSCICSSNPPSGYIPKGNENRILKSYMHSCVHWSIILISSDIETTWVPISKWMDKEMSYTYTYNGILFSQEKGISCHLQQYGWILRTLD